MHKKIITINEANQRLDKFLHKYLPKAGNSFIYKMLRKKNIILNGKKASGKEKISIDDEVTFFLSDDTINGFRVPSNTLKNYYEAFKQLAEIKIIFENEHLLIVDKPVDLLCQKAKPEDISLNDWLIGYLLSNNTINEDELKTFKPSILNRLDRNTSGIVLCGKSLIASQTISRLLKEKKIKRYYQLIVKGKITEAGELTGYLVKNKKTNKVKINAKNSSSKASIFTDTKKKQIITKYRPLKSNTEHALTEHILEHTLIEAELVTGKTHQIRAHFSSIGYPLIGDYKYGDHKINYEYKRLYGIESQLLHASRIVFPHLEAPLDNLSKLEISSEVPGFFIKLINDL